MVRQESMEGALDGSIQWGMEEKSELLLKLYEKSIDCMEQAVHLMEKGEMVAKGELLVRAQDIVLALGDAVDPKAGSPSLGGNLQRIYMYVYRLLIRGNTQLDVDAIHEARKHMVRLYSAWRDIAQQTVESARPVQRAIC